MLKRWLMISLLTALGVGASVLVSRARASGELSPGEARRVIARMAGIQLPSDAVRVKDISTSGNTAVVGAQGETAFRLVKGGREKRDAPEVSPRDRRWEEPGPVIKDPDLKNVG